MKRSGCVRDGTYLFKVQRTFLKGSEFTMQSINKKDDNETKAGKQDEIDGCGGIKIYRWAVTPDDNHHG